MVAWWKAKGGNVSRETYNLIIALWRRKWVLEAQVSKVRGTSEGWRRKGVRGARVKILEAQVSILPNANSENHGKNGANHRKAMKTPMKDRWIQ